MCASLSARRLSDGSKESTMTLRDAIDQDVFRIDDDRYTDADFRAMSIDDLETMKMRINKKIGGITIAMKEKQIGYAKMGDETSKSLCMNHRLAMSINQRVMTYINSLIRQRYREARGIGDAFMEQARAILPADDFANILDKAEKKLREGR